MKKSFVALLVLITFSAGCYFDSEEELYGLAGPCDTSNTTYAATVLPILQNYGCIGCHTGVSASGGIRLDTYTNVKTQADNGRLYGSISHSGGYSPMPQGANKMLTCDISRIKAWIDGGSPNN